MSRHLLLLGSMLLLMSCLKKSSLKTQAVWSDDIQTIELLLTGEEDLCDEVKVFTYPMSGQRLTPRRIELFKSIGEYTSHDPSQCEGSYLEYTRASFVVNPGSDRAIHYASQRDACLYYGNFQGDLRILSEQDFAKVLRELTPKRIDRLSYTKNETDAFYSREFDSENGPFGIALEGANPASFRPYSDTYASDDRSVWRESQRIEGADPKTFLAHDYMWAQDAEDVFYLGLAIAGVDRNTFEIIDSIYGKDHSAVYYLGKKIEAVDPLSFQPFVFGQFSRDGKQVIYNDQVVTGADVGTFRADPFTSYGRDAQAIYFQTKRLDLEIATAAILSGSYAKDSTKVYYQDLIIEGADPATFEVGTCQEGSMEPPKTWPALRCRPSYSKMYCFSRDKNAVYRDGVRIP